MGFKIYLYNVKKWPQKTLVKTIGERALSALES